MEVTQSQTTAHFIEGQHLLRTQALFALQLFTLVGNFTGFLLGFNHMESITGSRCAVQSQDKGRFRRTSLSHTLVTLIEHGLHLTIVGSCQNDIADFQCTIRNKYRGHITATFVERRFDNGTRSLTVRICFQLQHFSFQQDLLHQFMHADTLLGRDVL